MNYPFKKLKFWICIAGVVIGSILFLPHKAANADFWGGDIPLLIEIVTNTLQEITELKAIIGASQEAASVLDDMNQGVKAVLRLAQTAHIPISAQVYAQARSLSAALENSRQIYGEMSGNSPRYQQMHYQSGSEALYLSQDAFDYSSSLDSTGESIKASSLDANPSSAARLTAESLGVVLEALSHSNRLQAKSLEISATNRIQESQKDSARYESFVDTQDAVEGQFRSAETTDLNSLDGNGTGGGP